MKLDTCNIYYEAWQIQCCGKPFKIGDRVRWSCTIPKDEQIACEHKIDFCEEHHLDQTHTIEGTITGILAEIAVSLIGNLNYDSAPKYTMPLQEADGYETEELCREQGNRYFWGYIVSMKDVEVTEYDEKLIYDYD